jgi:hypothetical protein
MIEESTIERVGKALDGVTVKYHPRRKKTNDHARQWEVIRDDEARPIDPRVVAAFPTYEAAAFEADKLNRAERARAAIEAMREVTATGPPQDLTALNYLAAWRFAYSEALPDLAIMQLAFGSSVAEARAALADPKAETSAMKFVIDCGQAAELAAELERTASSIAAAKGKAKVSRTKRSTDRREQA